MPDSFGFDAQSTRRISDTVVGWERRNRTRPPGRRRANRGLGAEPAEIRIKNNTASVIPAWGLVEIVGIEEDGDDQVIYLVAKPKYSTAIAVAGLVLANRGTELAANGSEGDEGTAGDPHFGAWVLFDDAETPAVGQAWGLPTDDTAQHELEKLGRGFVVAGLHSSEDRLWCRGPDGIATRCRALVNGAFTAVSGTFNVDGVQGLNGVAPASSISGVVNAFSWDSDDNLEIDIEWSLTARNWRPYQKECNAPE